ncbi:MAG: HlyD family efflux transporter periplasmic adaptor subunit [Draconibacterium sp.]
MQIAAYKKYEIQLNDQCFIQKKELDLSQKQLGRDSALYSRQVMPEVQYEQSQSIFLKQQYSYKSTLANLSNTQIQIRQLEQKELELQIQKEEQERSLLSSLKEKYDNLNAQYSSWKQTFVLTAGIEGIITFTELWSEKQPVQAGNVVFTVVPKINQSIIGKLTIPLTGSGKVEPGQTVNIKLDNYPYMEFGLIESTIENISKVPVTNAEMGYYTAEVKLNKGLMTNYNKELFFAQEMQGTAEIITKDRRLLERLVQPVIAIFKQHVQ